MITVQEAHYRRVLESGGKNYAEVEVHTDHPQNPQLLAYFRKSSDGSYTLTRLMANDAKREIDWFDNNLHAAFEDVTSLMLSSPDHLANDDRESITDRILSYEGVKAALERELNP